MLLSSEDARPPNAFLRGRVSAIRAYYGLPLLTRTYRKIVKFAKFVVCISVSSVQSVGVIIRARLGDTRLLQFALANSHLQKIREIRVICS